MQKRRRRRFSGRKSARALSHARGHELSCTGMNVIGDRHALPLAERDRNTLTDRTALFGAEDSPPLSSGRVAVFSRQPQTTARRCPAHSLRYRASSNRLSCVPARGQVSIPPPVPPTHVYTQRRGLGDARSDRTSMQIYVTEWRMSDSDTGRRARGMVSAAAAGGSP